METPHDDSRALGEGLLAVPAAERDSGRWGAVYLADADGRPIGLRGIPVGRAAALTATALPDNDRVHTIQRRELLGLGTVGTEPITAAGRTGQAVSLAPADGRLTFRLDGIALARLSGRRVRLETHLAWPPGAATEPERRAA